MLISSDSIAEQPRRSCEEAARRTTHPLPVLQVLDHAIDYGQVGQHRRMPSDPKCFSVTLRRMRRMIVPERVLGKPGAHWIRSILVLARTAILLISVLARG